VFTNLLKWGHNRHYNRGMVHFNRGEYAQAAAEFEAVLGEVRDSSNPDHSLALCYAAEARANLGLAFFHAGQYAKAEEQFSKALEENPTFPDLRYFRARIFQRSGRLQEAVSELERALAEHPRYVEALLLLAVCRSQLDDREGSVRALNQALALGVELPAGLVASRAPEWAATDWQGLLAIPTRDSGAAAPSAAHLDRALERYHAGDLAGSLAELERAVAENPGYADLRCRLGGLLLEAGRIEEALGQLDHALRINPRYLEARLLVARARLELGDARDAVVHVEAALEAFPDYPDLHFWLGLARFRAGELAEAVAPLERAVKLNRQFARAQRLLGLIYHALGRHEDA
jgi:tetratricopeptide (TPR) repeat protein